MIGAFTCLELLALVCTGMFAKKICECRGWRKIRCIPWLILTECLVILIQNICYEKELTNFDAICLMIGLVIVAIISIRYVVNSTDVGMKIPIMLGWFSILTLFTLAAAMVDEKIMYFFKLLLMVLLIMGLMIVKDCVPIVRIFWSILVYVVMLFVNVSFTKNFLFSDVELVVSTIYEIFQRIYSLNPLSENMGDWGMITYMLDFLICRIMDVILLGFLSSNFMELCNNKKS
ncbi:MAG: hypothetical protein IJ282_11280 [Lachnospiraceae bacterium]|nr:hypothetical protein [Lachnospiraceae bacterium]